MVNFSRSIPQQTGDIFDTARNIVNGSNVDFPGFNSPPLPASSGFTSRQSRVPSGRTGRITRNMVRWFIPETGIVEMYINPQSFKWDNKKDISQVRTKNGFVLQYWGESLGTMNIQGTTGSSGIEGINVLYDVYRSEQVSFDPYALALSSARDQQALSDSDDILDLGRQTLSEGILNQVQDVLETGSTNPTRPKPTLASLAFQIEMYWSGWVFRGYFTDFSLSESADKIGLFDYTMNFVVTQRRGLRTNFFAWQRSPTSGPSDSSPERRGGVPHSFARLEGFPLPAQQDPNTGSNSAITAALQSDRPLLGDR
jgi:hypothetical protein